MIRGNSDAHRKMRIFSHEIEFSIGKTGTYLLGSTFHGFNALILEQQYELVTAVSERISVSAENFYNEFGKCDKNRIAARVAELVVNALEIIKINKGKHERSAFFIVRPDAVGKTVCKCCSVV